MEISAYRGGGIMIALQPDPGWAIQKLQTWAFDPSGTSTITPKLVTSEMITENGLHGMCRVPNLDAEGDFLVATGQEGQEGVQLRAFRSGPRQ